jgi:N-acylneuraminate cytidylyltransferase/CMP-N,N'-diacetyllegionaminic acid synthase
MRPQELARDDTPHNLVIRHAIDWMRGHHGVPDFIVLLQPTSPLRTAGDIDAAVELATTADADSVISVCRAPNHPFWTMRIDERGRLVPFVKAGDENFYSRRQDLPDAYALNGAVYVIRTDAFLATDSYLGDRTYPYIMPEARSLDIDTRWDLYVANLILSAPAFEDPS